MIISPPPVQTPPENFQISDSPEVGETYTATFSPLDLGFWKNLSSFTRSSFSGLTKLFSPAVPMSVNLSANPSSINFGQLNVYGSASRSFTVTNNGDRDAQVSFSTSFPFNVGGGRTIKPGSTVYFSVSFNPTRAGTFNGYITGSHGISIALNGKAIDPCKK